MCGKPLASLLALELLVEEIRGKSSLAVKTHLPSLDDYDKGGAQNNKWQANVQYIDGFWWRADNDEWDDLEW